MGPMGGWGGQDLPKSTSPCPSPISAPTPLMPMVPVAYPGYFVMRMPLVRSDVVKR